MKVKETVVRWLVPFLILCGVLVGLVIRFLMVTYQIETREVEEELVRAADGYAKQVQRELQNLSEASGVLANAIGKYRTGGEAGKEELLRSLLEESKAYMAVFCKESGSSIAILEESDKKQIIQLKNTAYFSEIAGEEERYIFAKDDGIMGRSAMICITPVMEKDVVIGYILQYYDTDNFHKMISKVEFDLESSYFLIQKSGERIAEFSKVRRDIYDADENFWASLKQNNSGGSGIVDRMTRFTEIGIKGVGYLPVKGGDQAIVYAPVGTSNWYVVLGINKTYVERQISKHWQPMRSTALQMLGAILVFLGGILTVNIISKIMEHEKSRMLEGKAETDLLTELNNKLATERKIKEYIQNHPGEQAVMFLLDIDNFKKINDTMGHAFGDEVLRKLGHRIKAEFRASDILGRTGGDEFMIFLCNVKEDILINREAERVNRFFKDFQTGDYVRYYTTASIGAAIYPRDAKDFEGLYKAADKAMYVAKEKGKNQLAFYGQGIRA